jgi:hypothetical protein
MTVCFCKRPKVLADDLVVVVVVGMDFTGVNVVVVAKTTTQSFQIFSVVAVVVQTMTKMTPWNDHGLSLSLMY